MVWPRDGAAASNSWEAAATAQGWYNCTSYCQAADGNPTLAVWLANGGTSSCTSNAGCCGPANGGSYYEYPWTQGTPCAAGSSATNGSLANNTWTWDCLSADNTTEAGCTAAQQPVYAWWPQGNCIPACGQSSYNVTSYVCFAMYWNGPNNESGALLSDPSPCNSGAFNTQYASFWSWYNGGDDVCYDYTNCGGPAASSIVTSGNGVDWSGMAGDIASGQGTAGNGGNSDDGSP